LIIQSRVDNQENLGCRIIILIAECSAYSGKLIQAETQYPLLDTFSGETHNL